MRLTIKAKLMASFAIVLTLLGIAGYFGISSLGQSNDTMESFANESFVQVSSAIDVQTALEGLRRTLSQTLSETDAAKLAAINADFEGYLKTIEDQLPRLLASTPEEQKASIADIVPLLKDLQSVTREAMKEAAAADPALGGKALKTTLPMQSALIADIARLRETMTAQGGEAAASGVNDLRRLVLQAQISMISTIDLIEDADIATASGDLDRLDAQFRPLLAGFSSGASPDVQMQLKDLGSSWATYFAELRRSADLGVANQMAKAQDIIETKHAPIAAKANDRLDEVRKQASATADTFVIQARTSYESTRATLIAIVVGAVMIGLGAAIWMSLSIARGLSRSVKLAEAIGSGDLTQSVETTGRDEIGDLLRAMNAMTEKLREIVSDVRNSAEQVASGAQQSAATAEQLSQGSTEQAAATQQLGQGATEQAAATEQASAAMEEMAANIRQNSENAMTTEKIAAQASINATKSGAAVANSVEAMRTIADKIRIVQEIARQTDLLALNAAIEAARAGQHGKGFAVVASEVRKLAERSQSAAAEINELSTSTLAISEEAGRMLEQLVPDIQRTSELVGEISAACREQNSGAEQINQAIQQLDQVTQQTTQAIQQLDEVTQQNAGAANEMSATAEQLSAEAGRLNERAAFFRLEEAAISAPPAAQGVRALQARVGSFAAQADDKPAKIRHLASARPKSTPAPARKGFDLDLDGRAPGDEAFEKMSA